MKHTLLSLIIMLLVFNSCSGQIVRSVSDAPLLELNKEKYINKTLKTFLADIKPDINLFFVNKQNNENGILTFYFVKYDQFVKYGREKKKMTRIMVYLNGSITDNNYDLPVQKRFLWTDQIVKEYEDLIITNIRVTKGDDSE